MTNNELYHYGIPGMKWGIIKAKQDYKIAKRGAKSDKEISDAKAKYKAVKDNWKAKNKEFNNDAKEYSKINDNYTKSLWSKNNQKKGKDYCNAVIEKGNALRELKKEGKILSGAALVAATAAAPILYMGYAISDGAKKLSSMH